MVWGTHQSTVAFQGLSFRFMGLDLQQSATIERRFAGYLSGIPSLEPFAQLFCQPGATRLPLARFSNARAEYQPEATHRDDRLSLVGYNFQLDARLTDTGLRGDLAATDAAALAGIDVVDNVLRFAAAYAALAQGGLLMHSAGVVIDGGAWLMLGRSNAGKSTLAVAALGAGRPILSDDINIVRPDAAGGFVSGAVPLTGDLRAEQIAAPDSRFPVRGLLWLEQADRLKLSPLSLALATARLLACAPVVNMDPYRRDQVLAVVQRLLAALPMHVLAFRRDEPFDAVANLLLGTLDKGAAGQDRA